MARRINLVPKAERVRTATNVGALAMLAGALVVVFALALSFFLLSSERGSLENELSLLEDRREDLERQVAALDEYKQLANKAVETEEVVRGVYAGRTLVSDVLSDLSRVLPENVWITSLTVTAGDPQTAPAEGQTGIVSGTGTVAMQGNTYSFPDVALLLVRLKLVSAFQQITLGGAGDPYGSVDPSKKIRGFSLTTTLVNTQSGDTQLPISKVEVEGL